MYPQSTTCPDTQRFWSKVNIGSGDECWPWLGHITPNGYGSFSAGGQTVRAHRYAYGVMYGLPEAFVYICHTCDNRACCNPRHLYHGSPALNSRDRNVRGRLAFGEHTGNSRLTASAVLEARRLHTIGIPIFTLARMAGVANSTMSSAVRRKTWQRI